MDTQTIYNLLIMILPLLFGITVHEAAHGFAARYCGDNTAAMMGRLTLNPIKHIDPIGTIAFPLGLYLLSTIMGTTPFIFGWAKPVPVNPRNYTRFSLKKSDILVSFAGPGSNLVQMFIWAFLMGISPVVPEIYTGVLGEMASYGIIINALLFTLNMLPILPLDGGHILDAFLPPNLSMNFRKLAIGNMGFIIVILLISTNPTRQWFHWLVWKVASLALIPAQILASLFS